jgi:hypothetical protein
MCLYTKGWGGGLFIYLFTKTVVVIQEEENVSEVYWSGKSLNYHLQFKIYGTTETSFDLLYEIIFCAKENERIDVSSFVVALLELFKALVFRISGR